MSHLANPPYPFAAIQVPPLLQGPLKVKARGEGGRGGRPTDASGAVGMSMSNFYRVICVLQDKVLLYGRHNIPPAERPLM